MSSDRRGLEFPLVSCLCVTEGRAEFMPWLLWNFEKQTWPNRELLIIDSSPEPVRMERTDVQVMHVSRGTNVPAKRNLALDAVRGKYFAWFDDDDWQHPERLTKLVRHLEDNDLSAAGSRQSFFINLWKGTCAPYNSPRDFVFNSAVFETSTARSVCFDERIIKGSDSPWMTTLRKQMGRSAQTLPGDQLLAEPPFRGVVPLSAWLCHEGNLSNPISRRRVVLPLSCMRDVVGRAWGETDRELSALRSSLSLAHGEEARGFHSVPSQSVG